VADNAKHGETPSDVQMTRDQFDSVTEQTDAAIGAARAEDELTAATPPRDDPEP